MSSINRYPAVIIAHPQFYIFISDFLRHGRKSTGKTVYILDEPTTGLHTADVHKLVQILQRLTEGGNTVIVIEHNLDVIKTADYIIDLGPEGGDGGGTIVAVGTPEEICRVSASYTGKYLKPLLDTKVETSRNSDFG